MKVGKREQVTRLAGFVVHADLGNVGATWHVVLSCRFGT